MRFLLGASWCVFPNDQDVGLDFSVRIEGSLCKGSDTSEQVSRDRLFRLAPLMGSQDDSLGTEMGWHDAGASDGIVFHVGYIQ